jgi:hypothetical protein
MLSGYLGVPVGIFAMGATGRDRIKRQSPMRRRSKPLIDNDSAALTWRIAAVTDLHWSEIPAHEHNCVSKGSSIAKLAAPAVTSPPMA